jgi:hypothetical protein
LRFHRRVLKQQYHGKGFYEYEQIAVPVPKKFHDLVKPFLDKDLEVSVKVLPPPDEGFMIILKPKKSSKPS